MVFKYRMTLVAGGILVAGSAVIIGIALTRVPPGVRAGNVALGGLSYTAAKDRLNHEALLFLESDIPVVVEGAGTVNVMPKDLGIAIDVDQTLEPIEYLSEGARLLSVVIGRRLDVAVTIDDEQFARKYHEVLKDVEVPARNASLKPVRSGFEILSSAPGLAVDKRSLKAQLLERSRQISAGPINVHRVPWQPDVTESEVGGAHQMWEMVSVSGPHTLRFEHASWVILRETYMSWLAFAPVQKSNGDIILGLELNAEKVKAYIEALAPEVDQLPTGPQVSLANGFLEETAPAQGGRKLNVEASVAAFENSLFSGKRETLVVADDMLPTVTLAALKKLGVSALLGRGESNFVGSPSNRIHNIKTGTQRYRSVLIEPNEEFSFNTLLGPVDGTTGYLPELVIKNNKIIPEYGGGLCQVSTTVFRGAIYAGLPIAERQNHSFIVSYYGAPGFDATIYPGSRDMRFVNDTGSAILLQTFVQGTKLIAEVYGTPTGREVKVQGPFTISSTPEGSSRTIVTRTITVNGKMTEDKFYSSYKPRASFTLQTNPFE